jgi:DNA-directed RNA polymerase III subunit RPC2
MQTRYRDIWIGEPRVEEELVVKHITPHLCRLRDLTYAAPIFVSVDYTRGKELVKRNGVLIGRMPIMLRSSKCVLSGLSDGECLAHVAFRCC